MNSLKMGAILVGVRPQIRILERPWAIQYRMAVLPGTRIANYEIHAVIGAGGMGEVYRAYDERLHREVAIKVLPPSCAADQERLRRFEQEARAAASLNHPNIVAIFQLGTQDGSPYVVSELLEGQTLRERLRSGPLPVRKAIEFAAQIARGMAAAHDKGIVHRDLKPENLFITREGQVKILDFGLAKLTRLPILKSVTAGATLDTANTDPGLVLGTVGYMSPEQVRGATADHRSDLFSFGAILYEMLSGKRAFQGNSPVETMSAILKEDPPPLSETNRNIPPALERVVSHCLEKNPEERFQSAHDVCFYLQELSGISSGTAIPALQAAAKPRRRVLAIAGAVLLVAALALLAGWKLSQRPAPSFQQLTFRHGTVESARFAPDGETIVYSAAWDGNPTQVFMARPESPESSPASLPPGTALLAVSPTGELAVSLNCGVRNIAGCVGTLARVSLTGSAPRELTEQVLYADWSPDGSQLLVARGIGKGFGNVLEFPAGKVLLQFTQSWISHPRVSPDGDKIAFLEHPPYGDWGTVELTDLNGKRRTLSRGWSSIQGLAWSPDGKEIFFTGTRSGGNRQLYAVSLSGKERALARVPGGVTIQDVSKSGRLLLTHDTARMGLLAKLPGDSKERDLSWFDWSLARGISPDGKMVAFSESGEAARGGTFAYVRRFDGSPAVRLGPGDPLQFTPDGKWLLTAVAEDKKFLLLPVGAGQARPISTGNVQPTGGARLFRDGKWIGFNGAEPGHEPRTYVQPLDGNQPRPVTPEGVIGQIATFDNKYILAATREVPGVEEDDRLMLYPIDGGQPKPAFGLEEREGPISWTADNKLLVSRFGQAPLQIHRVDLSSGKRELWKELMPSNPAGVRALYAFSTTPAGDAYVYSYHRVLSHLYVVDGAR
jgi:Tol biopolymer transport system component